MRAVFLGVDVILRIVPLRPVRAQEDPCAGQDASVLTFPLPNAVWSYQIIRIAFGLRANVYHARWTNKFSRWYAVHRIVGEILSGDPVNGCIKMSSRMLAGLKSVP